MYIYIYLILESIPIQHGSGIHNVILNILWTFLVLSAVRSTILTMWFVGFWEGWNIMKFVLLIFKESFFAISQLETDFKF